MSKTPVNTFESQDPANDPIVNVWDTIFEKYPNDSYKQHLIKVNLPGDAEDMKTGNGEGCWALPYEEDDREIEKADKAGTTFTAVLFNDSLYLPPLRAGSLLQCKVIPGQRPVLDVDWLCENIKTAVGIDLKAHMFTEQEEA